MSGPGNARRSARLPRTETLALETRAGWLTVWLDEPARRNPLTRARVDELLAVTEAVARSDLRAVLFRGRGGTFSAGGDLAMLRRAAAGELPREELLDASRATGHLLERIRTLPQLVVMALEGAAMAGGAGLAAAGDVVIATADTQVAFSETRIGLLPAQIASTVQARIGAARARRLLLLGARLDAEGARGEGLVDLVVADADALEAELDALRRSVARAAPGAVAGTKALLDALPSLDPAQQTERAARAFADQMASPEGAEGLASFFDKRLPAWAEEATT